jgi:hypothetical protein
MFVTVFKKRLLISHVGYLVSEGNITVNDELEMS